MTKSLDLFLAGSLLLILTSCLSSKSTTQTVTQTTRDTIYLCNTRHDSIYIYSSHDMDYHRGDLKLSETAEGVKLIETVDTIFIKDVATQFKYKLLGDTVYKTKIDSIPVIREISVTKEVKYTPWYVRLLAWLGLIVIAGLVIYTVWRLIRLYLTGK